MYSCALNPLLFAWHVQFASLEFEGRAVNSHIASGLGVCGTLQVPWRARVLGAGMLVTHVLPSDQLRRGKCHEDCLDNSLQLVHVDSSTDSYVSFRELMFRQRATALAQAAQGRKATPKQCDRSYTMCSESCSLPASNFPQRGGSLRWHCSTVTPASPTARKEQML